MIKILGISLALFTVVTFTDVIAENVSPQLQAAIEVSQPQSDLIWFADEFWADENWADPALTDKPILKSSTATVPVVYDEARVISAQNYLRAVSAQIDANMMWSDNADFERNRY